MRGFNFDMRVKQAFCALLAGAGLLFGSVLHAADGTIDLTVTNGSKQLKLPLVSGVDAFRVLRAPSLNTPFAPVESGSISGYLWTQPGADGAEFFRVEMQPKDPQAVLNANLLHRLGYGPTPEDIARLNQIGPDAYIQEQLAPEAIEENLEVDRVVPATGDWQYATVTGTASSSSTLYIYLTMPGEVYIDDIKLVRGTVAEVGTSALSNGDFEAGFGTWIVDEI